MLNTPFETTLERHVLVKLEPEHATPAVRAELVAATHAIYSALPQVVSFQVAVPADDHATASWDLALTVRFRTLEDVQAYRVHPDHVRYVEDVLKPKMAVLKAWNFDTGAAGAGGAA